MPSPAPRTVLLALHPTQPHARTLAWPQLVQILAWHGYPACIPHIVLPVTRRRLPRRRTRQFLLEPTRHDDGITRAAGGPIHRLDLHALATHARLAAEARWWTWHHLIAATTPAAKPWSHFLGQHLADPQKISRDQARQRFEDQPRVLAMLAHNTYPAGTHQFEIDDLDEYQAGQAVYIALHWQQGLTGDLLIDPHGRLHQPATGTLADRLRYLAAATRVVHALGPDDHLVAVRGTTAP